VFPKTQTFPTSTDPPSITSPTPPPSEEDLTATPPSLTTNPSNTTEFCPAPLTWVRTPASHFVADESTTEMVPALPWRAASMPNRQLVKCVFWIVVTCDHLKKMAVSVSVKLRDLSKYCCEATWRPMAPPLNVWVSLSATLHRCGYLPAGVEGKGCEAGNGEWEDILRSRTEEYERNTYTIGNQHCRPSIGHRNARVSRRDRHVDVHVRQTAAL
jgi:hypothetical protein